MQISQQFIATVLAVGVAGVAYAYDFSAIQNAVMNDPAVQQQVGAQVMKNPQLLTGAAGATGTAGMTGAAGMMAALSPAQKTQLMTQANAIAAKLFTPSEQKSLQAFQATPDGASITGKLPTLVQQLAPVLLQMYAGTGVK
ncbi:MAG TPA: hypothetical protein VHP58_03970 [Alphaproteobacteria bacterium]|nr:hypothetical protein [Alphaproteobacteria bacterium]